MGKETIIKKTDANADAKKIVFSVEGGLDFTSGIELQETLISAFREYTHITLDFAGLSHISSDGLRVLLMAQKTASGRKGSLAIVNASGQIRKTLDISGFNHNLM